VAYQVSPIPMTLSDIEGHFTVWNLSNSRTSSNTACIIYDVFTRELDSAHRL